ncbi:adenosylcobinamide-GDP ribazoletransferase [Streptomyces hainanensis]|nr:adenosylcobinamide-GDP ribazoletransferase [Streptomyces hainanensis]
MNATPPEPPTDATPASSLDGLRFALGTLTVLPVRVARWDRAAARVGMACAPVAGLVVGGAAAVVAWFLGVLGVGPLLAAVLVVAVPVVLSRGLHLDGLADVADALGSGRPADEALRIMKRSDIGPFGVVTLLFALGAQVAALAETGGGAPAAALVAGLVSRAALTWACRVSGPPSARPTGLGAGVARVVPVPAVVAALGGTVVVVAAAGALSGGVAGALAACCAVGLGLSAAEGLLWHCRRRFGGVTGDVLGAAAEVAGTTALVTLAVARG